MWNFRSCAVLFTLTESNMKSSMCNPWRRCNIFNVPNSVMIGFIYIKEHANQQTCVIVVKMRLKLKRKYRNTARIREREGRKWPSLKREGRGGEGGNKVGEWEKCSSCTLSFKRAKNFIPGKDLSFSPFLRKNLWVLSCCLPTHQLSQCLTYKDKPVFSRVFITLLFPLMQPSPELADQTKSAAAQGWLGS